MAIVNELEASVQSPTKLVLARVSTSRGVGLDGLPSAVKVVWRLDVLSILDVELALATSCIGTSYLGRWIFDIFESGLPVEVWLNGVEES